MLCKSRMLSVFACKISGTSKQTIQVSEQIVRVAFSYTQVIQMVFFHMQFISDAAFCWKSVNRNDFCARGSQRMDLKFCRLCGTSAL